MRYETLVARFWLRVRGVPQSSCRRQSRDKRQELWHLKVPGCSLVWNAHLTKSYVKVTSFYAKVDKDLTSTNQQILKSPINDLIVKEELLATATNLIITTPRTSCIYFLK